MIKLILIRNVDNPFYSIYTLAWPSTPTTTEFWETASRFLASPCLRLSQTYVSILSSQCSFYSHHCHELRQDAVLSSSTCEYLWVISHFRGCIICYLYIKMCIAYFLPFYTTFLWMYIYKIFVQNICLTNMKYITANILLYHRFTAG